MERLNIADIGGERPNLAKELEWRHVEELWKLNDVPTGPDAERTGRRVWILLARGANNNYIIQSTAGTKSSPDKFITWVHYGGGLDAGGQQEQEPPKGAGYVVIDKSKLGRPRRELTGEEVEQIRARHEAGDGINKIAKALHMGTRKIMEALRE